jgi:hypothetical protein
MAPSHGIREVAHLVHKLIARMGPYLLALLRKHGLRS